jgi:16S rRNA (uracil1498-N3)-methyltransferase
MGLTRVFTESTLKCNENVELPETASHHINKVLRMKPGQKIHVFNGRGGYYEAEISAVGKRAVTVIPLQYVSEERESNLKITLVQGISRGQRMDYTIQKAVELGVMQIVPLVTEFSNVNLEENRVQNRLRHWRSIIINSCEQCRRTRIPEIITPVLYSDWIYRDPHPVKIILVPGFERNMKALNPADPVLSLLSGPEGGLSKAEISNAIGAGYQAVGLGPRILRTETAAITALSAAQVLWGDMG